MPPRNVDRSITTCRNCRRRKIRCDRTRPRCDRCREIDKLCVYEEQVPRKGPTFRFVDGMPEQSSNTVEQQSESGREPADVAISAERLQNIEARVDSLKQMVNTVMATQSSSSQQSSPSLFAASNNVMQVPDPEQPQGKPITVGHLSKQGGGRVRYVEPSFWASLCEQVAELDELIYAQARQSTNSTVREGDIEPASSMDDSLAPYDTTTHAQQCVHSHTASQDLAARHSQMQSGQGKFGAGISARHIGILQDLPPKEQCVALLDCFMRGYHPMVPLIHIASFRRRYAIFWESQNMLNTPSPSFNAFISLMLAVIYAGSVVCPNSLTYAPRNGTSSQDISEYLYNLTVKALQLSHFPRSPTLDSYRAYLISQSVTMREEEPLKSIAFAGLALRVANMLGLHRDPSHHLDMDPVEAEERRRCWWHLIHLDVLLAIASGLPPIVDLESWDVRQISECKDDLLGTVTTGNCEDLTSNPNASPKESGVPPQATDESLVSVAGILAGGKLRYSLLLRRTLSWLSTGRQLTAAELVAMRREFSLLEDDLKSRIARIPDLNSPSFGTTPIIETFENNATLNLWTRLLLSALIDQSFCMFYHPLVRAAAHQMWPDLKIQSIERCQSFLIKCAQMVSLDEFAHFHWSWPGNHQPLHATMILLIDLIQKPNSSTAARSVQVIDIIFALNGPTGGLVAGSGNAKNLAQRQLNEGGREAWEYLRRLRVRAWLKGGLDPDVVWTRQQAVLYCVSETEQTPDPSQLKSAGNPDVSGWIGEQDELLHGLAGTQDVKMDFTDIDWTYPDAMFGGVWQPVYLDVEHLWADT